MNKREKEVIQLQLEAEEDILAELEKQYKRALNDINEKIKFLQTDELTQSRIYQIQYQQALKGQIEGIIEKLHSDGYTSIQQFLNSAYTDAFIGTAYDLAGQGIPLIMPIDQNAAVKAIITDSKIKEDLYTALGVDAKALKKTIRQEITRGIASGMNYQDIARNISDAAKAPLSRAKTIARTESHRIQQASTYDAQKSAKKRGADVVKQWDSTLDGRTRSTHRHLDGQIKEVEKPFEMDGKKAMFPGEFGDPGEDCNCRCVSLTRAKWALDDDELKTLQERAEFFGLDKTEDFADYKKKYLKAVENSGKSSTINSKLTNRKIKDGTTVINPMDASKYQKLKANLEKQGVHVIQAEGDDLKYLQAIGAEASYGNGYIMHIGEIPSASGMFEEMIHSTQAKKYGEFLDSDPVELYAREVAANRLLLKNGNAYGFDEIDFEDIERNLANWEEKFERLVGVSYDESEYSREI